MMPSFPLIAHRAKILALLFGILAAVGVATTSQALTSQQQGAIAANSQNHELLAETATYITFGEPEIWREALLAAGDANPAAIGMVAACMTTAYPFLALDVANAVATKWPEEGAFVAAVLALIVPSAGEALTAQFGPYDGPDQAAIDRIAIAAERRCSDIVTAKVASDVPVVGFSEEFQDIPSPN